MEINITSEDVKLAPDAAGWWLYQHSDWGTMWDFVLVNHAITQYYRTFMGHPIPLPEPEGTAARWVGPLQVNYGPKHPKPK